MGRSPWKVRRASLGILCWDSSDKALPYGIRTELRSRGANATLVQGSTQTVGGAERSRNHDPRFRDSHWVSLLGAIVRDCARCPSPQPMAIVPGILLNRVEGNTNQATEIRREENNGGWKGRDHD